MLGVSGIVLVVVASAGVTREDDFTEAEMTPGYIALASSWLRDEDRSRYLAHSGFFSDLRQWLYSHRYLTKRQALHVLNLMAHSDELEPYVEHLRVTQTQATTVVKLCASGRSGAVHASHAWEGGGVAYSCPGVEERAVKYTAATVRARFVYNTNTLVAHIIERAQFQWCPRSDVWGYFPPELHLILPCRVVSEWANYELVPDKAVDVVFRVRGARWCKSCLSLSPRRDIPYRVHSSAALVPESRRCPAVGLSRQSDATFRCRLKVDHDGRHRDPDTKDWWSAQEAVRLR